MNFIDNRKTNFEGNITILNFLGDKPMENITGTLNLKELVYDKFKGFKKFQIISISSLKSEKSLESVKRELLKSDELKYFSYLSFPSKLLIRLILELKFPFLFCLYSVNKILISSFIFFLISETIIELYEYKPNGSILFSI